LGWVWFWFLKLKDGLHHAENPAGLIIREKGKKRKQTRALNKLHICRCNEAAQPKPEERKMDGSGPTKATAHTD